MLIAAFFAILGSVSAIMGPFLNCSRYVEGKTGNTLSTFIHNGGYFYNEQWINGVDQTDELLSGTANWLNGLTVYIKADTFTTPSTNPNFTAPATGQAIVYVAEDFKSINIVQTKAMLFQGEYKC